MGEHEKSRGNNGPSRGSRRPTSEAASHGGLGIAGNLAQVFIDSPLTPLFILAALVVGIIGLLVTPRQEDPDIAVPMVDVFLKYPGVPAEQVARLAVSPLERMLSEIPEVKHVYSMTRHGEGLVTVRFEVGEAMGPSVVKVHEKIQSNLDQMPPGGIEPLVKPKGIDNVPIITLTLWSNAVDDHVLRNVGHALLQRLKEVDNTGEGFVVGGHPEQLRIEVRPEQLAAHGVTLERLARVVRAANLEVDVGRIEGGNTHYRVYSGDFLRTPRDVAGLVVGARGGKPVYLRDVADVTLAPEELTRRVSFFSGPAADLPEGADGAPAVTVALAKKHGANGVTVANALLERLEALKPVMVPTNVHVAVTRNYGETANDKVNDLLGSLLLAAVAVSILSWIALGWRAAAVVVVVIPIVILLTVTGAWAMGYSINRVSLFALIFAIGILVDDATVVVENIFRRWLAHGETDALTAVDAVREVGNPTIIATLTVLAALLPMGFVTGMMGPYMEPIPVLGSVAMLISLGAAFVFTPWLSRRLRPRMAALEKSAERERHIQAGVGRFYVPMMHGLLAKRRRIWALVAITLVALAASVALLLFKAVPVKMLPYDNKPTFQVVVNLPEGSPLLETENLIRELTGELRELPEVRSVQGYTGTASPYDFNGMVRHYYLRSAPWQGDLRVRLVDKEERARSSHQLAMVARERLTPIAREAGARIAVVERPPGPPVLQTLVAEVYGPSAEVRRQVARDLTGIFEATPHVVDVDNRLQADHAVWRFDVDREKAVRSGVRVKDINESLKMAMGGYRLGDLKHGPYLEPTWIVVELPMAVRSHLERLRDLPVPARDGTSVPLSELGEFVREPADPVIHRKDLRPIEYVTAGMEGPLGAPIYGMLGIHERLADYRTPGGEPLDAHFTGPPPLALSAAFEWTGEWTVTYETFRDLGLAFMAALMLIFMLIVWEFGSFVSAVIIMAPIPLTLIGILPGHWLLGAEMTATSMIGLIALAGIIVRNSILLVDFAEDAIGRGESVKDAVIEAGRIRMRPIVITDLTLMVGAATILTDPIFRGMAISLLFGPVLATTLTLVMVPLGSIAAARFFPGADGQGDKGQGGDDRDGNPSREES